MNVIFAFSLKRILTQRLVLVLMLLLPAFIMFIRQPDHAAAPTIGYGLFGLIILFAAFMMTKQMLEDRQQKTLVRIAASPITHRQYLTGNLLAYTLVMGVQVTFFWVLSIIFWNAPIGFSLLGYAFLMGLALFAVSFSLFWHGLFRSFGTSIAIYSVAINIIAGFSGLSFPLEILPQSMRNIAVVIPPYWYSYGLEFLSQENHLLAVVCLLILLGFAIMFLVIGSRRRLE